MSSETVTMTCMTTKQKFDAVDPEVVVLANGRYAYRVQCPWKGKNDKDLFAFKFCSMSAYEQFQSRKSTDVAEQEVVDHEQSKGEQ